MVVFEIWSNKNLYKASYNISPVDDHTNGIEHFKSDLQHFISCSEIVVYILDFIQHTVNIKLLAMIKINVDILITNHNTQVFWEKSSPCLGSTKV